MRSLNLAVFLLFSANVRSTDVQWLELGADSFESDGNSRIASKLELPISSCAYLRRKFRITELYPDLFVNKENYSFYSDINRQYLLQVSINVWLCRKADNVCKQHSGPTSVHLGVDPDDVVPSTYAAVNATEPEITLHTSFCAHPPNLFTWHLALSSTVPDTLERSASAIVSAEPNASEVEPVAESSLRLLANVRVELLRAHCVGGTTAALTTPTTLLLLRNGTNYLRVQLSMERTQVVKAIS